MGTKNNNNGREICCIRFCKKVFYYILIFNFLFLQTESEDSFFQVEIQNSVIRRVSRGFLEEEEENKSEGNSNVNNNGLFANSLMNGVILGEAMNNNNSNRNSGKNEKEVKLDLNDGFSENNLFNVPEKERKGSENLCCICLTNPKDCVLKPCSHVCVCSKDAKHLLKLRSGKHKKILFEG